MESTTDHDGSADRILNRTQLAQIFGVSENTINKWHADGMPVENVGGNGRAYEFRWSDCKRWYDEKQSAANDKRREDDDFIKRQQAAFTGLNEGKGRQGLSAKEMKGLAEAQLVIMQADARRRALIPVEDVVDLLDTIFTDVRAALEAKPDWLEREFSLTPEQVVVAVKYNDGILKKMQSAIAARNFSDVDDQDGGLNQGLF